MVNSLLIQETTNPNSGEGRPSPGSHVYSFPGASGWPGDHQAYSVHCSRSLSFLKMSSRPLGCWLIVTVFMILVTAAKKVAWVIVGVGWILLLIRILMVIFKLG